MTHPPIVGTVDPPGKLIGPRIMQVAWGGMSTKGDIDI